jgi:hypothetical protein
VSFLLGMAVLTAIGMVVIWAPAYPEPEDRRHPHMRAMDRLGERRCSSCRAPLDAFGWCTGPCAGEVWEQ